MGCSAYVLHTTNSVRGPTVAYNVCNKSVTSTCLVEGISRRFHDVLAVGVTGKSA